MKRVVVFLMTFLLFSSSSFGYSIAKAQVSDFSTNGDLISSWYWIRRSGQYAQWRVKFTRPMAKPIAILCFETLSTNTYNGGPGFNSYLMMTEPYRRRVNFRNDCGCIKVFGIKHYQSGVCYKSHGCITVKIKIGKMGKKGKLISQIESKMKFLNINQKNTGNFSNPLAPSITVRVQYAGGHHTAVKSSSLRVYYLTQ